MFKLVDKKIITIFITRLSAYINNINLERVIQGFSLVSSHWVYGRCTSISGSSRNHGMTLSNEIPSVTETIKFACNIINI